MLSRPPINTLISRAGKYRIYWLLLAIYALMAGIAPNFLSEKNQAGILKAMSTHIPVAIGFTLVLICGHLDLSFGACLTLGGMLVIGLQPRIGWGESLCIALLAGAVCGLANGLMVTKAKINSFIATLGTMAVVQGFINIYSKGGTLFVENFSLGDWLETPVAPLLGPRVIICAGLVILFELFLRRTRLAKGFYVVGSNIQTAWYGGLNTSACIIGAFVLSGVLAALGGALFAISLSSANPTMGNQSLMLVIAAVIIGGASMKGGKGSVVSSMIALLGLTALINGLSCMGAGFEIQLIASGLVLALIVLYDAYAAYRHESARGQRADLLQQLSEDFGKR